MIAMKRSVAKKKRAVDFKFKSSVELVSNVWEQRQYATLGPPGRRRDREGQGLFIFRKIATETQEAQRI
ncbi:MAG: hypothetical protein H0T60_07990 [Acidobacteria bacterium]|nr:hypothetical protein [Acidobacteriota bacterium]